MSASPSRFQSPTPLTLSLISCNSNLRPSHSKGWELVILFISSFIHEFIHPSTHYLSTIYPTIHNPSTHPFEQIHPYVHPSICPSPIYLLIHIPFIYPSIHLSFTYLPIQLMSPRVSMSCLPSFRLYLLMCYLYASHTSLTICTNFATFTYNLYYYLLNIFI